VRDVWLTKGLVTVLRCPALAPIALAAGDACERERPQVDISEARHLHDRRFHGFPRALADEVQRKAAHTAPVFPVAHPDPGSLQRCLDVLEQL
jgi:hypothetical protein